MCRFFLISLFCNHITNIPQRVLNILSVISIVILFHVLSVQSISHTHTKLLMIKLNCIILTSLTCLQKSMCMSKSTLTSIHPSIHPSMWLWQHYPVMGLRDVTSQTTEIFPVTSTTSVCTFVHTGSKYMIILS